ncbi:MAG: CDP-glycerol glycerophosphotransferase family protein [Firmicutes bacterium]|nr:CDP-glycerol glycerophosphotransferase family protein [Bacillota bacterium]
MRILLEKMGNIAEYAKCCFLYFVCLIISCFMRNTSSYKDLWLISERTQDARDNGYHFFKYLRENQKHINCAYVIDKNSPDYSKVKGLGKIIQPGGLKHYIAFACAKVKVSTHIMGYAPDPYRFAILDRKFKIVRGKKIFLQHGIIKDDIAELHYPKVNLDLFVCSTAMEYESLKDYNYPNGVIKRLGLCRYDALLGEHQVKRQILVMPTWRYYLRTMNNEEFKQSEYYKSFNSLITDERLNRMLDENDYELVLYLHYELQKFTNLFCTDNKRVKVMGMLDTDVQTLLMESAMLITDYSSVFFDFAYMKKPMVYWTFDRELFFSEQYGLGYFKFSESGFGPEFSKKEQVVDYIEMEMARGMAVEDKYLQRTDRTFSDFSKEHCKKTYEAILELI